MIQLTCPSGFLSFSFSSKARNDTRCRPLGGTSRRKPDPPNQRQPRVLPKTRKGSSKCSSLGAEIVRGDPVGPNRPSPERRVQRNGLPPLIRLSSCPGTTDSPRGGSLTSITTLGIDPGKAPPQGWPGRGRPPRCREGIDLVPLSVSRTPGLLYSRGGPRWSGRPDGSLRVTRNLDRGVRFRGYPPGIRTEKGPEFTGEALDQWLYEARLDLRFVQPDKPTRNASVESFNDRFWFECPNEHWPEPGRKGIRTSWRDYNEQRPIPRFPGCGVYRGRSRTSGGRKPGILSGRIPRGPSLAGNNPKTGEGTGHLGAIAV